MRYPGFLGPWNKSSSVFADQETLVNLYRETGTPTGALLPTPGFQEIGDVPEGPGRGSLRVGTSTFFVAGYRVYERSSVTGAITARATLTAADSHPVTLSWNGPDPNELFITSADVGYILNLTTFALTVVLLTGASQGAYLDGYFLAIDAATGTLQISDLLDGLTWDPTQIALRSQASDPWVAMTVVRAEIWLFGTLTSEVWRNAGTFPFPFEPIPGALLEQGIAAPYSVTRDVSPLLWVSQNAAGARVILMAQGYQGVRVSTHPIEHAMAAYASVDMALAFDYQEEGHGFYVLTFPDEATWAFDVTEAGRSGNELAWARRAYWNTLTSTWEPLRVRTHVYTSDGLHLMQDRSSGALYRMGLDLFTDVDGALMLRERTPPRLSAPGQVRFTVPDLQLIMDVGVGVLGSSTTDPSVNPAAMLQTSKDGGRTWGPERTASIGRLGEYLTRVHWHVLGQYRNFMARFRFACACPIRIVDCEIEMRVGTS